MNELMNKILFEPILFFEFSSDHFKILQSEEGHFFSFFTKQRSKITSALAPRAKILNLLSYLCIKEGGSSLHPICRQKLYCIQNGTNNDSRDDE